MVVGSFRALRVDYALYQSYFGAVLVACVDQGCFTGEVTECRVCVVMPLSLAPSWHATPKFPWIGRYCTPYFDLMFHIGSDAVVCKGFELVLQYLLKVGLSYHRQFL